MRRIWDIHRSQRLFLFARITAALGANNQDGETLGITLKLKITSQATNFIKQILSFLGIWWKLFCEVSELNLF
jgi:hypothetical protein